MEQPSTLIDNRPDAGGFRLLVMGPDQFTTYTLPPTGVVAIGRAETASIRLTDPVASRQHACLHVGSGFEIEDLGSANKTRVRDVELSPGQRVGLQPGEAITIGSTILMLQASGPAPRPRRIWPHDHFEARLETECARSDGTSEPFAVVRVHVAGDTPAARVAELLLPALRGPDMFAIYGPGEFEVLLANTTPDMAAAVTGDLEAKLRERGVECRTGLACYGRDGRTPSSLLGVSCSRVRGPEARTLPSVENAPVVPDTAMRKVMHLAERAAAGTISILIGGETGVGKEVMAQSIHRLSPRAKATFLCFNCAAFNETLLESELFGHERGAFTDAVAAKPGLLETAPGGTVFLDEVGEMPPKLQAKLLRVLETREVTRVGSLKSRSIDVRFVAATNRNLELDVAEGRFRRDLFFRLNGIMLQIPPLRERRAEIAPLARLFAADFARAMNQGPPDLAPEAVRLLEDYLWPGNIRELRNVIERALLLCGGATITGEHLPVETMLAAAAPAVFAPAPVASSTVARAMTLADAPSDEPAGERERILRVLAECAGNQSRAARVLKISRSTLVAKLDDYQIARPRKGV